MLNSAKVSEGEGMYIMCPLNFAQWTSVVTTRGAIPVEWHGDSSQQERGACVVGEALEIVHVDNFFRSSAVNRDGIVAEGGI